MTYKIQKKCSLIEMRGALEGQVQEHSQKVSQKEQQEAEAPIIIPGIIRNRLLITQGNGYPGHALLITSGIITSVLPLKLALRRCHRRTVMVARPQ